MTAKEYLNQMRTIRYQIKVKKIELKELQEDITVLKSVALSEKVKSSKCSSFTFGVEKAIMIEEDIANETLKKINTYYDIRKKLNGLENERDIALLTDRYINCRRSVDIANDMHYDDAYIRKLIANAVESFKNKYGDFF